MSSLRPPALLAALALLGAVTSGCAALNERFEHTSVGPGNEASLSVLYEAPPSVVRAALRDAMRDSLSLEPSSEAGVLKATHRGEHFRARLAARTAPASPAERDSLLPGAQTRLDLDFSYWRRTGAPFSNLAMRLHSATTQLLHAEEDRRGERPSSIRFLPQPLPSDSATCLRMREASSAERGRNVVVGRKPQLVGGLPALYEELRYPTFALMANQEGQVVVQFIVDERGTVPCADVVMGVSPRLNASALEAVRAQRFRPGRVEGEAVAMRMLLPVTFLL